MSTSGITEGLPLFDKIEAEAHQSGNDSSVDSASPTGKSYTLLVVPHLARGYEAA